MLTGHTRADFEPLAALWADPAIVRHIGATPSTPQDSWARLLRYRGLWPILGYGYWAIRDRHTGQYLGDAGFADFHRATIPSIGGVPEAGWALIAACHGSGYASEAVSAALAWLDQNTPFTTAVCLIDRANAASRRIAEKNRFRPAGAVTLGADPIPLFSRNRLPPGP